MRRSGWLERVRDFVGRNAEFRAISQHLAGASRDGVPRTVIVAGPPGVGKTALAIEATQRLREPGSLPLFLDLLGPNPALARPALSVVQALLREVFDPQDGDPPSTLDACVAKWQEMCARRDRIIVLDNAAEEAQIRPVLAGGPVRVVVTSRRSLAGLEDVERIHLDPLPSPDSIRLLHDIVPPGQRTDRDIIELARLCSDLPLALRIAATESQASPRAPRPTSSGGSAPTTSGYVLWSPGTSPPRQRSGCPTTTSTRSPRTCSATSASATG
jgi:AAA ATPase domain